MAIDIVMFEPTEKDQQLARALGYDKIYSLYSLKKLKILSGEDDIANRRALESRGTDILLNPHAARSKDFMHFRNAGLNHILCKLAADNKIAIGFSLDRMYESNDLGRVKLALRLCKKYKNDIAVFSLAKNPFELRSKKDIIAFLNVIGMESSQANNALEVTQKLISNK